jgi:uncharacterized protein YwgA
MKTGLKEQILTAKNFNEVTKLFENGVSNYTLASEKTKRAWKRVVNQRFFESKEEKNSEVSKPELTDHVEPKKFKTKKLSLKRK